jgi:hypothetical protein
MPSNDENLKPARFAAGMLIGGATGFAIWMVTELFVFLPAFLGVGVVLGLVLSAAGNKDK